MNEEMKDGKRLPVVAWRAFNDIGDQITEWIDGSPPETFVDYFNEQIVTGIRIECAYADAQALLSQKDARIAQLAAHARGKNKALANALKEIERLKYEINEPEWDAIVTRLENQNEELRAQLDQLQAAPAERGVAPAALSRAFITSESVDGNYRVVIKSATLQETQQVHNWLVRLNPAPATADSDVPGGEES